MPTIKLNEILTTKEHVNIFDDIVRISEEINDLIESARPNNDVSFSEYTTNEQKFIGTKKKLKFDFDSAKIPNAVIEKNNLFEYITITKRYALENLNFSYESKQKIEHLLDILLQKANTLYGSIKNKNFDENNTNIENNPNEKLIEDLNAEVIKAQKATADVIEITKEFEHIRDLSKSLPEDVENRLKRVDELYDSNLKTLQAKIKDIDDLFGIASGRLISGAYDKNAESEKRVADYLRYGSLFFMFIIVSIVCYAFFETTQTDFNWQTTLSRLGLAIVLSIPSAYLAKESSKHREQQYAYLQTSLDLKAIDPYIASLPESQKHLIKANVADRLFAAKNFSRVSSESSYPINTNQLIMELLKRAENPKKETAKT